MRAGVEIGKVMMNSGPWGGENLDCSAVVTFRLMCLGATSTSKTSGIGDVCVAQWLECSTHDRKVPGSNPTSNTRVFSSVFNPPSVVLVPRTTEYDC